MDPTLADDEARLSDIATQLGQALVGSIGPWLEREGRTRLGRADPALNSAASDAAAALAPEIQRILHADVDSGAGSPLAAIRAATGALTTTLRALNAPLPVRDPFSAETFPDDVYDLGPAAFADIDEALHEPGLMWGAARAHVHLRRRREAES